MKIKAAVSLLLALAALTGPGATDVEAYNPIGGALSLAQGCTDTIRHEPQRSFGSLLVRDRDAAADLRARAEAGDATSQFYLGRSLLPAPEAAAWLCCAADRGHVWSRFVIADLYAGGLAPFGASPVRARLWYGLAAAAGHAVAAREAELLTARMTPAQIAEAGRLARSWAPGQCEAAAAATPSPKER